MPRHYTIAAVLLLVIVAASNVYRAATQSFTSPEFTGSGKVLAAGAMTGVFGLYEFSLRLPDVIGGLLYLAAIFLLCRLAFGDSPWLLFGVALNTLNPFILDACSMASGRGLGLGFWTLGAYFVARWAADRKPVPIAAGAALGIAIAADPQQTFAVAALDVAFAAGVVLSRLRAREVRGALRFVLRDALPFCLVTVLTAFAFFWRGGPAQFVDQTAGRFLDGVKALTSAFLLYGPTLLTSSGTLQRLLARLGWAPLALLVAGACIAALRRQAPEREHRLLILFSSTAAFAAALVWCEPRVMHHRFFAARGLEFIQPPIFVLCPLFLRRLHGTRLRAVAMSGTALAGLLLLLFVLQFQTHSYYGSEPEAATRTVIDIIQQRQAAEPKNPVLIAARASLKPSLDGYRRLREIGWLAQLPENSLECHADFYYLSEEHFARLTALGLQAISRDRVAGTVLAEIGSEARGRLAALRKLGFTDVPQCNAGLLAEGGWIDSARAGAARHFLRDVADRMEPDRWRWTYGRPAMLFDVPKRDGARFKMDFVIHGVFFRGKTPLELTVRVNGKEIGRRRYGSLESQTFQAPVPAEVLRNDGMALVETTLDKYYIAPEDGQRMGYLFVRGGFLK